MYARGSMKKPHTKLELESLIHLIEGKNTQPFSLSIEEDLAHLRICIQYLLFENEAIKREYKILKKLK